MVVHSISVKLIINVYYTVDLLRSVANARVKLIINVYYTVDLSIVKFLINLN